MLPATTRSSQPWSRELLQCLCPHQCCPRGSRAISTNSAIARALRQTSDDHRFSGQRVRPLFRKELAKFDKRRDKDRAQKSNQKYHAKKEKQMEAAKAMSPADREAALEEAVELRQQQVRRHVEDGPIAVPHTTAASQFIYGVSAVKAALLAKRRKLYKLYLHGRALSREGFVRPHRRPSITDAIAANEEKGDDTLDDLAARIPGLEVLKVGDGFLSIMDKMSEGRPHNGVILESSPLPALPVMALRPVMRSRPHFDFDLDKQSREQKEINGGNNRLSYNSHGWRFPLILYLDGIVDEGNLGAIIRSAYYFGVDAVAVSKRATAPLDAVAIKASSGAAEAMPIMTVSNPLSFLTRSALNGWRVYAADTPPPPTDNFNVTSDHFPHALDPQNTSPLVTFTRPNTRAVLLEHSPVLQHPVILMFGGESAGFRQSILKKANYLVGIRGTKGLEVGVDSLNVSVAAALIMLELLRKPNIPKTLSEELAKETGGNKKQRRTDDDQVQNDELLF